MTDDDHAVRNAVEHLVPDLYDDARYARLSDDDRAAVLVWQLDSRIRSDGIGGWIETDGPRSDDLLAALARVGAREYEVVLRAAFDLFPTRLADDPDTRLSAMDDWTDEQSGTYHRVQGEHIALTRVDNPVDRYIRPLVLDRHRDAPGSDRRPPA